jgi:hypothetical protein
VTGPPVRLHPGLVVDGDGVVDTATGARGGRAPAELLAAGHARLPHTAAVRARLVLAAARSRSREPLRALRLGFHRRHPPGRGAAAVAAVTMAARLPVALMALLVTVPALAVGLAFDVAGAAVQVAVGATATGLVSLVAHESAHLVAVRLVTGDRAAGAIAHSWTTVWIVGPPLHGAARRLAALAGPPAGALAAAGCAGTGVPPWVCAAYAAVHLANLAPAAPDGRMVFA